MRLLMQNNQLRKHRAFATADVTVRDFGNWKCYGSAKWALVPGFDKECVRLESRKRIARIRIKPSLVPNLEYKVSVNLLSPMTNITREVGTMNGCGAPGLGHWRKVETTLKGGEDLIIKAAAPDGNYSPGDLCYVDLSTLRIWA